jgi:hypothetical protein
MAVMKLWGSLVVTEAMDVGKARNVYSRVPPCEVLKLSVCGIEWYVNCDAAVRRRIPHLGALDDRVIWYNVTLTVF